MRQKIPARVKLKLLENEDHLFDAGFYLGFVGTIICLILVSLRIIQFSLMAAYSSTSFGIIFVSVLKIFKVRPARRQLLLQAEEEKRSLINRPTLPRHEPDHPHCHLRFFAGQSAGIFHGGHQQSRRAFHSGRAGFGQCRAHQSHRRPRRIWAT